MNKQNEMILKKLIILLFALIIGCSSNKSLNDEQIRTWLEKGNLSGLDSNFMNQKAIDHTIMGSKFYAQKKYAESIIEFQEALRYDSSFVIKYNLAKSYKEYEKYELAELTIGEVLIQEPEFKLGLELLAEINLYRFRIDTSIAIYKKLIELEDSRKYKMTLARLYEYKSDDSAVEIYEELIAKEFDYNIAIRLSNIYRISNKREKYINILKRINENAPENIQNNFNLVEYYMTEQDNNELMKFLDKLNYQIGKDDLLEIYTSVGQYLIDTPVDSLVDFKTNFIENVDKLFNFDWRINLLAGFIAEGIKETDYADDLITHSMKYFDEDFPSVPLQAGLFYFRIEENEKAISVLEQFYEKYPNDWLYPYYLSIAYTNDKNYTKALKLINKSLEIEKLNVDLLNHKAYIYDSVNMIEQSDSLYKLSLEIEPQNPSANNNFAYSLAKRELRLDDALKMAETALKYDNENSAYLDTYGFVKFKLGDFDTALKYIEKAVENDNASSEVFENLGDVLHKLNRNSEAIDAYKKALELEPDRTSIIEKIKMLED